MVLQIAELESATTMPPYERAAFESELGQTWLSHLDDPEEALHAFERALEADAEFPAALEGLATLHQKAGRLDEAAALLERLTEHLRGPERAPVWIALGTLFMGPLGDRARAQRCFEAALEDDPFQTSAVEWSLLIATEQEDWGAVAELLEARFDLAAGARHRAAIAVEASQLQLNHIGSRPGARAWVERAVELAHDEPAVLLAAADIERADGDEEALRKLLEELISLAGPKANRATLVEAAELDAHFGDNEKALARIRLAAQKSGEDDRRMLELQARLLRDADEKRELAEVLETLAALQGIPDSLRAEHLRELATLSEREFGEEDSAESNWQRAFELEPADTDALCALERIHRKRDDWDALQRTFEIAVEAADDSTRAPVAAKLGLLLVDCFEDARRARELFESALELDPKCRTAMDGLRQIADQSGDTALLLDVCEREAAGCEDADLMAELARAAIPILQDREQNEEALVWAIRWTDLAPKAHAAIELRADFEAQLERCEDEIESRQRLARLQAGPEKSSTLRRLAELLLERDDAVEAATALESALEAEPASLETQRALCKIYRTLDRPEDLARGLQQLSDDLPPAERAEPLGELAEVLEDPIGDLDTAIVVRWRLADLPDAPSDAMPRLEGLLELAGRHSELAHLYETRRQQLGDDSDEATELDMRRAKLLLDSLGHCEEAAEIFAALHERAPDDEEILDLLERALRAGDNARGLCDLLERRAGWEGEGERKIAMELERASLLDEALGEPLAACDLYETIARTHHHSTHRSVALERLESLLESNGQWVRLRSLLLSRLDDLPQQEQATQRERIASICRDELQDIAGCAEQLEVIAGLVSDRVHVWQQLHEIYAHALDRPADWLRVVEAELESEPDDERELTLRVGAARLCLDDERRPAEHVASEAYAHYERVLALNPAHAEAAEVLAMHFNAEGRPEETARVLELRLTNAIETNSGEADDLHLRLADLCSDALEDDERARGHLEAAHGSLGPAPKVAEPLSALLERTDDFDALSSLCREAIASMEDGNGQLPWRVRLGASEQRAGRPDDAAVAYRAALVSTPDDREIEDALIEIYEELGESDPLIELLEKRLAFAREDEMVELRIRLSKLHADERDEPREALEHLRLILESHPHRRDALGHALELAEQIHDPELIVELIDRSLALSLPTVERADLLERRGHLMADELDAPDQAVAHFREALSLDCERRSAREGLRTQLELLLRWPAVLDCLFIEASEADPDRRAALFEEACEIATSQISPDAALPWLTRLRSERPNDPELLSRLAEVHRRAGRFEAALRALDEQLLLTESKAERHVLQVERAQLLERELHAPGRAVLAYQQALELAGSDTGQILTELDRLYDLMGRSVDRAGILESRVAGLDLHEGIELRQALASLYCVDLSKPDLAIPHLMNNVAASRSDAHEEMRHLGQLDAALRSCDRHDAWARTAERQLELVATDPGVADSTPAPFRRFLREELVRTYDIELGNSERAIEHLRILAQTAGDEPDERRAHAMLRDLLRRSGRAAELAQSLSAHLTTGEAGTSCEWLELAQLREESLHDLSGALTAYRKAEIDPDLRLDAIRGRRRCCERLRDWNELASALEDEFEFTPHLERSQRTALARKLGDTCWQRLAQGERAATGYQRALDLDGKDRLALRSLISVKEAVGETTDVVVLYRRELTLLGDEGEDRSRRIEVWLRMASLLRDDEASAQEAIDAYHAADELERLSATDELYLARLHEARGDFAAFAETFGRWCDRDDSGAHVDDHIALARQLMEHGVHEEALARAERATAVAPEDADAWILVAELQRAGEAPEESADAFERAAAHSPAKAAAELLAEAAGCLEAIDLERTHRLLERASELDPASLIAQLALTRVASRRDDPHQTERTAEIALELARHESPADPAHLETAVLGGRAAHTLGHRDASRRLFTIVLEIDGDHAEALESVGYAHYEDGDYGAARGVLEHRIELPGENTALGRQLAMIARGLEFEEHLDAAWSRYEEAIEADPTREEAHEGLVRIHERAARPGDALAALERWCDTSTDGTVVAAAALRAAEHALALEDRDHARRNLDRATDADPQATPAWLLRCELAAEYESENETRRLCSAALEAIEPSPLAAPIALRAARLAEIAGQMQEAIGYYGDAAAWDVRCGEAALCESRLVRMTGDWAEADRVLAHFIEAHPDPESPTLAHVHLERGRLLSGPLEDVEQAIRAYERALALQPELRVAQMSLAKLLLHAPDRWRDALRIHREILETSPTTAASLRALVELAERRGEPDLAGGGLAVLRALGLASPLEAKRAPAVLRFPIHPGPPMAETDAERFRRIAHQLNGELGGVLANVEERLPACEEGEVAEAAHQIAELEDELTAKNFSRLDANERASLFDAIAGLFLDPGGNAGDSPFRDSLDRAIGRWTRRKVRHIVEETTLEAVQSYDYTTWGDELRAMAAAQVIDRNGGDLLSVLRALILLNGSDELRPHFENAEIGTLASTCDPARRLLVRITTLLCERLEHAR